MSSNENKKEIHLPNRHLPEIAYGHGSNNPPRKLTVRDAAKLRHVFTLTEAERQLLEYYFLIWAPGEELARSITFNFATTVLNHNGYQYEITLCPPEININKLYLISCRVNLPANFKVALIQEPKFSPSEEQLLRFGHLNESPKP